MDSVCLSFINRPLSLTCTVARPNAICLLHLCYYLVICILMTFQKSAKTTDLPKVIYERRDVLRVILVAYSPQFLGKLANLFTVVLAGSSEKGELFTCRLCMLI